MYEEGMLKSAPAKELSPGEKIYDLLQGFEPQIQRQALREAEERIHENFAKQKERLNEQAKELELRWQQFKGS